MERDFLWSIIVRVISLILLVVTIAYFGAKYDEMSYRVKEYNKELLSILDEE